MACRRVVDSGFCKHQRDLKTGRLDGRVSLEHVFQRIDLAQIEPLLPEIGSMDSQRVCEETRPVLRLLALTFGAEARTRSHLFTNTSMHNVIYHTLEKPRFSAENC